MYGHPELESLAHPSGFDAGPDPTPESGVEQAEADALLDAEGGVGIEPQGIFGERAGEGPVAPEFVFWRIDATLELVRGEAVLLLEPPGMLHQLVGAPDLRLPRLGIRVPEEEVAREGHPVPELAADQRVNRDSELLPHKIQAPKLYGGMKLGAVVVEAGCRVHDLEPERLELEGVMADEVGLETFEGLLRALPSSPHLAKTDEAIVGLHLDYSAHEASPVGPAGMLERRLQWDRYGGRSYVGYLQGSSYATAGLFRQSYPEGCEQTAVDPVICSRHKARLRACEEADHLGDLFWPGNPSQGMHPAPVLDRRLDGVLPLEEISRPSQHRCVNRTRTYSIDPYVLFGVIQGHRPC